MNIKFNQRVDRLADKIAISKTPVPGFVMGLSGTDSIVAFLVCYEALKKHNKQDCLIGLHFVETDTIATWFWKEIIPWLKDRCPEAYIRVSHLRYNDEEDRWHSLKAEANVDNYWVAACINATEKFLGTYSILSKSASIWPVATLWKTDILQICSDLDIPKIAMNMARIPDCICGRDELAAENLELIDEIIQFKADTTKHDPELLKKLFEWVRDTKSQYDFKDRTPYLI